MFGVTRREFISFLGTGAALALPLSASAQQRVIPVIGVLSTRSSATDADFLVALRQGLSESGFDEGRNVAIEYRYAEGRLDQLPSLAADRPSAQEQTSRRPSSRSVSQKRRSTDGSDCGSAF